MKTLPNRPTKNEQKWVDFDQDTNLYGIFGLDSGFCYSLHYSEEEANKQLQKEEFPESVVQRRVEL